MPEPTKEELLRRIAELEQQVQPKPSALEFRVSDKGGVSVYRLGRFPVTLYFTDHGGRLCIRMSVRQQYLDRGKMPSQPEGYRTIIRCRDAFCCPLWHRTN